MAFYNQWYEQSVCHNKRNSTRATLSGDFSFDTGKTDLTAAQVTVHSVQDKLVYNLEFKPWDSPSSRPAQKQNTAHSRLTSYSSTSSTSSSSSLGFYQPSQLAALAAGATPEAASAATHKPRRHTRSISRDSDMSSTSSIASELSKDSLWDDWIVKFINDAPKVDDDSLEEWIFDNHL